MGRVLYIGSSIHLFDLIKFLAKCLNADEGHKGNFSKCCKQGFPYQYFTGARAWKSKIKEHLRKFLFYPSQNLNSCKYTIYE